MTWEEEIDYWHTKYQEITKKQVLPMTITEELKDLHDLIDVAIKMLVADEGAHAIKQVAYSLYFFALPQLKKIQKEIKNAI